MVKQYIVLRYKETKNIQQGHRNDVISNYFKNIKKVIMNY